jgi:hypothetical protein
MKRMKDKVKFNVFMNGTSNGPFEVSELFAIPGFSLETPVMPYGRDEWWGPAAQYPAITDFSGQTFSSGDYKPEPIAPQERATIQNNDWRRAVIGRDIPEVKSYAAASGEPSHESKNQPDVSLPQPSEEKKTFSAAAHHRKGILLLLLGFSFAELYIPKTDNLATFFADLNVDDSAMSAMGYRFQHGGSPHVGGQSMHETISQKAPVTPEHSNAAGKTAPEIVEIGSDDLGNGFLSKMIVITETHDGVRTQRTTTITVKSPKH